MRSTTRTELPESISAATIPPVNQAANSLLTQPQPPRWLQHSAAPSLLAGLLALLLYAVTLGGTYVYDDVFIVYQDQRLQHPDQWIQLWKTDYFNGGIDNLYRPLVSMSYAIQWLLHGDRPWAFHAVNILLNALTAAAVAEFTRRALGKNPIAHNAAIIAGLLFAAHPVHVEAVANIVGRAEVICTGAILWGLIVLCHRPLTLPRAAAVLSIGLFALLCKEQGILQPVFWLFLICLIWKVSYPSSAIEIPTGDTAIDSPRLDYERKQPLSTMAREKQVLKLFVLLTSWIWAAYMILRERFLKFEWDRTYMDPIIQPLIQSHGWDRILMPIVLAGRYVALLFWPVHLSPDYGGDVIGSVARASDPYLWLGLAAGMLGLGGILFLGYPYIRQRFSRNQTVALHPAAASTGQHQLRRFLLFCLLATGMTYGLIGNILTLIGTNFAERLLYLPSAFLLMIAALFFARWPVKPRVLLLSILISLMSWRTITAARTWNHPMQLFQIGLANQPKSAQLHLLLAEKYHDAGNDAEARRLYREATDLYPHYWHVWMFRAIQDMDEGDLVDAEMSIKKAVACKADPVLIGLSDRLEKLKAAEKK